MGDLDAIVILGCRVGPGELRGAVARRVALGASLYLAGVSATVLTTGGRRWRGETEAIAMADSLVLLGVPRDIILTEARSRDTRGNARFSAPLLRARGATKIALVTCDFHLPRATRLFEREGFEVTGHAALSPRASLGQAVYLRAREALSRVLDGV